MKAVAIKIDSGLYRDIHIRAAEQGQYLYAYVIRLIERDLHPERFPQIFTGHLEAIKQTMAELEELVENVQRL